VIAEFGGSIADPAGGVDRARLGAIVFSDPAARARLEAIVHPLVTSEIDARIEGIRARGGGPIVIVDAALLVETGADRRFDRLVVVTCSEELQLERLVASRRLTREEALARIRAQAGSEEKALRADYRIVNDGTRAETEAQVGRIYRSLLKDAQDPGA
jgi:dephospho-CoA kinase